MGSTNAGVARQHVSIAAGVNDTIPDPNGNRAERRRAKKLKIKPKHVAK